MAYQSRIETVPPKNRRYLGEVNPFKLLSLVCINQNPAS